MRKPEAGVNPRAREHRFRRLKELGCIPCWSIGIPDVYPEINHLNLGGHAGQKRLGDEFTEPLCVWHHQGHGPASLYERLGPSLKLHPNEFRERFGSDEQRLAKVNDLIRQRDELAYGWRKAPQSEAERVG
jgi:hypothetical protein